MFLDILQQLKDIHSPETISSWITNGGLLILFAIIFSETGLLLGFFLPGDSLLITAGVLSNTANPSYVSGLDPLVLNIVLVCAAVIGDQTGFLLGKKAGVAIYDRPDGRFIKQKHLIAARQFYEQYGAWAIVGCRYIPIFRTFVPFVAGVTGMPYKKYAPWSMLGGLLWITSLIWIGYYLGQTPLAKSLDRIIVIVVIVSLMPPAIGFIRKLLKKEG